MRPRHRFRIALLVLLSLLFQQAAVAAYACDMNPMTAAPPASEAVRAPMDSHCTGMDQPQPPDNPALCAKHCAPDQSTLVEHLVLTVPAILAPPARFALMAGLVGEDVALSDVAVVRSDPPPRLRYCSLLI